MSDKSPSENELFDYDKDSPGNKDDDNDDVADPEVPVRDEDEDDNGDDPDAQGPVPGESEADAGYGGEENYARDEQGENMDETGDYDDPRKITEEGQGEEEEEAQEGELMDMVYTKDEDEGQADDDVFDYDEDDSSRRDKKKKKKDKSEKSKKRKKVKREYEGEEAEEDPDAEDRENRPRKGKKRKQQDEVADEEDIDNLIEEMNLAYEEDIHSFKNKEPALAKLKLLNKVEISLKRLANQRAFIDLQHNGLDILAKWLTKLPGGAPPSMQLKKRLVDIIFQLPVTDEHLKNSDIGKVLYGMRSNPGEDPELKRNLKDIIDKWTRLITDMANDYAVNTEDIRDRKKIDISLDDYRQRSMSQLRRSIPKLTMKKSGFDFVRKPPTEGSSRRSDKSKQQEATDEFDKMMRDMKRKVKKEFK